MRLRSIKTRGFGHNDLDIDLEAFGDARLIAVCGPNGAGKSTALELWGPGAFYRKTPTRGPLAALALARDATLEVGVVNGQSWTLRHVVDGVSGKGEAVVFDASGAPVLPDGKVKSFDAWAAAHLPDPSVLFITTFAAQGSGGFAALSRAERMAVIGRVVANIEELETKADAARERARAFTVQAETLNARLADAKAGTCGIDLAERACLDAQARCDSAVATLTQSRAALGDAQTAAVRWAKLREDYESALALAAKTATEREALTKSISDLEGRVANNRRVLERAAEIRAAVTEERRAREELPALEREVAAARERAASVEGECGKIITSINAEEENRRRAVQLVQASRARLADEERVKRAVGDLPRRRDHLAKLQAQLAVSEADLETVQREALVGADTRITALRAGLTSVLDVVQLPDEERDAFERLDIVGRAALDTLNLDEERRLAATSHPARLSTARDAVRSRRAAIETVALQVTADEMLAALAPELERARQELANAETDVRNAESAGAGFEASLAKYRKVLEQHYQAIRDAEAKSRLVKSRLDEVGRVTSLAEPLARAEARLAELEPQLSAARVELAALVVVEPIAPSGEAPDVAAAEAAVETAETAAREAHAASALAGQRLVDAKTAQERIDAIETELRIAEAELADWRRLAEDLGRDGLQALEIDAGGPELSSIATDLLHAAYGPRWTVSLDTTRVSADGKRTIEDCEINVIDTLRGREGPLETFSGGERVILGEAVSLALTTIACRNSGIERPTLVRDESGAALDEAAGRAYVAMLRRAGELIDADRVLFVSHSPAMQELADARIEIGGAA